MKDLRRVLAALFLVAIVLLATSGRFLVVDQPEPSDVIVVLAGETDRRPRRALDLLRQNYAPRVLLDVPAAAEVYDHSMLDLAQTYVQRLPQSSQISICAISGLSTKAETRDVASCLKGMNVRSILLDTSDYHTRRARSTFRHEFPGVKVSVAAAYDSAQFGGHWWQHRQWAKTNLDEWFRLVWWELVDRWH